MKILSWYVMSSAATIISLTVFREDIRFTKMSAGVLILAIVSAVIAVSMNGRESAGMNTVGLNDSERVNFGRTLARVIIASIPLYFPLVFFFSDTIRLALGLVILMGSIVLGATVFRVRFGDEIKSRRENEKCELEAARKREEEGKI